jgi:hypothetical protein
MATPADDWKVGTVPNRPAAVNRRPVPGTRIAQRVEVRHAVLLKQGDLAAGQHAANGVQSWPLRLIKKGRPRRGLLV